MTAKRSKKDVKMRRVAAHVDAAYLRAAVDALPLSGRVLIKVDYWLGETSAWFALVHCGYLGETKENAVANVIQAVCTEHGDK